MLFSVSIPCLMAESSLFCEWSTIFLLQEKRERPLWQRMPARLLVKGSLSSFQKKWMTYFWWIFGGILEFFVGKTNVHHVFTMFFRWNSHVNDSCPRAHGDHTPLPRCRFWLIGRQSDEELFIWSALQCTEMLGLKLWPASITAIVTMMMIIIIYLYYIYCYYIITIWWLVIILISLIIMCISYFWPWAIMINVFCLSSGPTLDGSLNPLIFSSKWVLISYLAGVMLSTRPPSYELVYKSH